MKLLIIEDDENLASTLARRFTKQGFTCSLAHNAEQALQHITTFEASHFLVDLKLGDDNGLALIKPLREQLPSARIVLLTGFASIASAVEAIRLGADDYLPKPVDFNSLLKTILGDAEVNLSLEESKPNKIMSPERLEWEHIQHVLHSNDGNISETARQLNMHRRTLQRKLQKKPVKQ
ncbi:MULTISPECIES: response regulator transcription factor [unclassified Pseudoalteromonas]|uniref:response regulator transcription factor n=1 Tax=unclassified Pseudoalteromonas TaxID=194690 RepID=UPI00110A3BE8|nr:MULTISPECIES: response regulator transcription factor [unclassified Pseudoalteromonas]TMP49208.1 two-component system response regulator [Pseudoalteromonas sp. S1650]TMP67675.1 two-component system response regulator [Pseudoalteromonas sp. S1649]